MKIRFQTKQELFDFVIPKLREQGKQSLGASNDAEYCRYRGDDGSMCAIGLCIPEDKYSPDFEGVSISNEGERETVRRILEAAGIPETMWHVACELQDLHDTNANWTSSGLKESAIENCRRNLRL